MWRFKFIINFLIVIDILKCNLGYCTTVIFFTTVQQPQWAKASSLLRIHDHTQIHQTRWDSSGRVISPTQRPLPDNTQHSQQAHIYDPGGIRTRIPNKWAAADPRLRLRAATGIGICTWLGLLIWGLLNDAFNIWAHTATNDNLISDSELVRITKEVVVAQFEIIYRNWRGRTVQNHDVNTQGAH